MDQISYDVPPTRMVKASSIPDALRADFEMRGEDVVARILASPKTHDLNTPGVPPWADTDETRKPAFLWLNEKRRSRDRREWWLFRLVVTGVIIGAVSLVIALLGFVHGPIGW